MTNSLVTTKQRKADSKRLMEALEAFEVSLLTRDKLVSEKM